MNSSLQQNYFYVMTKHILFSLAIITILSCTEKKTEPDGIITPIKMAEIISEIYISEYKVRNVGVKADSIATLFHHYEMRTYEQYNTTDSLYKASFEHYLNYPEQLESIYDMVIDSLSLKQQVLEKTKSMTKNR
ncbi:MAG: hypothetical protein ACJAT1_001396 [Marivirga sp.]|jgi:hypothetical protein